MRTFLMFKHPEGGGIVAVEGVSVEIGTEEAIVACVALEGVSVEIMTEEPYP